jgi:hypothetical protein
VTGEGQPGFLLRDQKTKLLENSNMSTEILKYPKPAEGSPNAVQPEDKTEGTQHAAQVTEIA